MAGFRRARIVRRGSERGSVAGDVKAPIVMSDNRSGRRTLTVDCRSARSCARAGWARPQCCGGRPAEELSRQIAPAPCIGGTTPYGRRCRRRRPHALCARSERPTRRLRRSDETRAPDERDPLEGSVRCGWCESSKRSSASVGAGAPFRGQAIPLAGDEGNPLRSLLSFRPAPWRSRTAADWHRRRRSGRRRRVAQFRVRRSLPTSRMTRPRGGLCLCKPGESAVVS